MSIRPNIKLRQIKYDVKKVTVKNTFELLFIVVTKDSTSENEYY